MKLHMPFHSRDLSLFMPFHPSGPPSQCFRLVPAIPRPRAQHSHYSRGAVAQTEVLGWLEGDKKIDSAIFCFLPESPKP